MVQEVGVSMTRWKVTTLVVKHLCVGTNSGGEWYGSYRSPRTGVSHSIRCTCSIRKRRREREDWRKAAAAAIIIIIDRHGSL